MMAEVHRYETNRGDRIYRLPVEAFPGFWANCYLLLMAGHRILVDVGSGLGNSNDQLAAGLERVQSEYQEQVSLANLTHVLISHGHIDHFGGLPYVGEHSQALVAVHPLDLPVLIDYETRLEIVELRLKQYLIEAGLSAADQQELMDMYLLNKSLFASVGVDLTFDAIEMRIDGLQIIHTPGHCPGQVVMRLGDVLLSSDHVLPNVSPHQSPERLSLGAGLEHFLHSLRQVRRLAPGIRLTLPGHGEPVPDLDKRIDEIEAVHFRRLQQVLAFMAQPRTIGELAAELFPNAAGYHRLLAVEEAGAHVEYLQSRGFISLTAGKDEVGYPQTLRYQRLERSPAALPIDLGSELLSFDRDHTERRIDV